MPLVEIEISVNGSDLPKDVGAFRREADLRVSQCVRNSPIRPTGFVPSNFAGMVAVPKTASSQDPADLREY